MTVSDFSKLLKKETRKSHTMAENTKFMQGFLRGVVDRESFGRLISNFYFIYHAMETEIERLKDHPVVGRLRFESLNRRDALAKDCEYFFGKDWRNIIYPTEQGRRYVDRIREVSHKEPELLVAHHYTRYLGDLSGGQILKGIAQKALNVGEEGLNFYNFPLIKDSKEFKSEYRSTLDQLPITESQANSIIVESNYVFRLNMYMFDELDGDLFKSLVKVFWGFVKGIFK